MRFGLIALLAVLLAAVVAHADFVIETLATGDTGYLTNLALDSAQRPGICFADEEEDSLRYGEWRGGDWSFQTLDYEGDVGSYCSMYYDPLDDQPHIAYRDNGDKFVRYTHRTGGEWPVITLDGAAPVGVGISMARGANGWPRVASIQLDYFAVAYNWLTAEGPYTTYVSDWQNVGGEHVGLAIDSSNVSNIAFHETVWGDVWLARGHDETWEFLQIDGDTSVAALGADLAFALDADDQFHVAYHNDTAGTLFYATGTWDDFDIERIDAQGNCGSPLDLTIDSAGAPHVCYYDEAAVMLRYAYRGPNRWHVYRIADNVGLDCSIVVDDAGVVSIAYRDAPPSTLYLAQGDAEGMPEYGTGDDDDDDDDDDTTTDDDAVDDDVVDDDATDDDVADDDAVDDDTTGDDDATDDDAADDDDDDDGGSCGC